MFIILSITINWIRFIKSKLFPILIISPPLSLIYLLLVLSYFEDYLINKISIIASLSLLFLVYQSLPLLTVISYLILNIGVILVIVSIKVGFISVSLMVGNVITVYLYSVMVVMVNYVLEIVAIGYQVVAMLLYVFLMDGSVMLVVLCMVEVFALGFQTLTLANRISVNIISGSMLLQLLAIAMLYLLNWWIEIVILVVIVVMNGYELMSSVIQWVVYGLLSRVYLG